MATAQQPTQPTQSEWGAGVIEITVMEEMNEQEDRQRILAVLAQEAAALRAELAEVRADLDALRADLAAAD